MSHFVVPNHIIVGNGVLNEAAPILKKMGNKAFIVTGKHVAVSDMMKKLISLLDENDIRYVVFDGIIGEPDDVMIENRSFVSCSARNVQCYVTERMSQLCSIRCI
ncbi:MAG: iron-containing alcohol dehydrogenase [Ruminococcus bromii]|nr:iron-containing alcohol dehydrogenase [Ruminococcus bromii]